MMARMRLLTPRVMAAAAALALLAGFRDTRSFTLEQMLAASDGGVVGTIEARSVQEVAVEDGTSMFFTTLRIVGTDLATGDPATVEVLFAGGFVDATRGTFNASAPPADWTRIGRGVLAFHDHIDDIAGGLAGSVLVGARAGLFTTFESRRGATIVQGRGRGHAVARNQKLIDLRQTVSEVLARSRSPR